ncbi:MAG: carboxypeptidase regulatory-like domain-containing protein [Nitrospirae bacterium]|nr:carboxypeptidase regulatory-like domain-containing protein [Nitrospirota bacterium]
MSVGGRIVDDATSQGVDGVTVFLREAPGTARGFQQATKDGGRYTFKNVRAGQYLFYALAPAGYVNIIKPIPVEVPVGQNIVELNVRLKKGGIISGVVYQGDGVTPLANAPVSATTLDGGVGAGLTGTDGRYNVTGLAPSASYRVTVFAIGQAAVVQQGVAVSAGATTTLSLTASSHPTEVRGTVLDAVANPIPNATVTLSPQAPENVSDISGSIGVGVTDAIGTFSIRGLKPGTYRAQVKAQGYGSVDQWDIVVPSSGTITLSFTLSIKTGTYGQPFYAGAFSPFGRVPGPDLLPAAGGVPLAPEFVPLILRVACPPPPPPPPNNAMQCIDNCFKHYLLELALAGATHVAASLACPFLVFPPAIVACEAAAWTYFVYELYTAYNNLQGCMEGCLKEPPTPPGDPCKCEGPDCKPPDSDRPDDWRGVPPLRIGA